MKHLTLIAIISVLLLTVQAANLRPTYDPLPQLLKMKDQSEFAKSLISTVELHLTSGGKVEEVIQYVKEAKQGTEQEKVDLSTEFNTEMQRYDDEIEKLELDLNQMNIELQNTILEISNLTKDIKSLEATQNLLEQDLLKLDERESNVRQARDNDIAAFGQRQIRDANAIKALNEIIPQLNDLLLGGSSLVQKTQEELNTYLRVKDVNDPIRSLVQMSMKFNKAKLSTVIQKLENILEAIQVAKEQDEQQEKESAARFDQLIQEIEQIKSSKQQELKKVKSQKLTKESELEQARGSKDRLELNIDSTNILLEQTKTTQEQARESFQRRIKDAQAAIQALTDALSILENNQESLTATENDTDSRLPSSE